MRASDLKHLIILDIFNAQPEPLFAKGTFHGYKTIAVRRYFYRQSKVVHSARLSFPT